MSSPLVAESIFAAIGLDAILAGKPDLHQYRTDAAVTMPRNIRRRLLAFLVNDSFKPARDMRDFNYDETLNLLGSLDPANPVLPSEQSRALLVATNDPELAMDLGHIASKCLAWAVAAIPRPQPYGYTGAEEKPDAITQRDFARCWEVCRDPLSVLGDLEDGSLADDQVAVLVQAFPSLHAEMKQTATDAIGIIASRRKGWQPDPVKGVLLGVLRQEPTFDAELFTLTQAMYAEEAQPPTPPQGGGRARSPNPPPTTEGTKGQEAAANVAAS